MWSYNVNVIVTQDHVLNKISAELSAAIDKHVKLVINEDETISLLTTVEQQTKINLLIECYKQGMLKSGWYGIGKANTLKVNLINSKLKAIFEDNILVTLNKNKRYNLEFKFTSAPSEKLNVPEVVSELKILYNGLHHGIHLHHRTTKKANKFFYPGINTDFIYSEDKLAVSFLHKSTTTYPCFSGYFEVTVKTTYWSPSRNGTFYCNDPLEFKNTCEMIFGIVDVLSYEVNVDSENNLDTWCFNIKDINLEEGYINAVDEVIKALAVIYRLGEFNHTDNYTRIARIYQKRKQFKLGK